MSSQFKHQLVGCVECVNRKACLIESVGERLEYIIPVGAFLNVKVESKQIACLGDRFHQRIEVIVNDSTDPCAHILKHADHGWDHGLGHKVKRRVHSWKQSIAELFHLLVDSHLSR